MIKYDWKHSKTRDNIFDALEGEWCVAQIEQAIKTSGDYYTDNFRYARKSDLESVDRYEKAKAEGCCGYADWETTRTVDGIDTVYLLGYNYGH
jgi:hypothetical protein